VALVSGCDAQLRGIDLASGEEKFTADLGALSPGSPAVADQKIVVGTDGGHVLCFNTDGPKLAWDYDKVEGGAMVFASPSIADGVVVVGARDRKVHGIDLTTGKQLWTLQARGDVEAPAAISDGRAYVTSKDKKLYVLDLKTGKELWSFTASRGIEAGVAIGSGVLVLADTGGMVYCLESQK
jgi:outer membrane protein assembly factor BamB